MSGRSPDLDRVALVGWLFRVEKGREFVFAATSSGLTTVTVFFFFLGWRASARSWSSCSVAGNVGSTIV
jgi:hypothetical protein